MSNYLSDEKKEELAIATPDICERLEVWTKLKTERLDFEFLTLMRDAVNAIKTEREMHNAWRKRAEEAELREASLIEENAELKAANEKLREQLQDLKLITRRYIAEGIPEVDEALRGVTQ